MTTAIRAVFATALLLHPALASAQQQSALVRGRVYGPDGRPVAAATVTLLDQRGTPVSRTETAAGGGFRLEDVSPGRYTLFAEGAAGGASARVLTVTGALPIAVELTLGTQIIESVVVRGSDGPSVTTRTTVAGEALRQSPTRLSSQGVPQLLATLPGWASEDNGLLHVRGVDDGILYVEDGVPIYDRVDMLSGIAANPAGIGSMNVLTGYIPPEYGLKSGAVVELQSATAQRKAWTASVNAGIGSDVTRTVRTLAGGPAGDRATLVVSAAAERSDRFLDPVHPDNLHNHGGVFSGEGNASVLPSDRDHVRIKAAGGRSRYQVPHGALQEAAAQDQQQSLRQNSQSTSWQRFWSDATVSHVTAYRREADVDLLGSATDTPLSASSDRHHHRLGVLAALTHLRNLHTIKFGVETARLRLTEDFSFAVTSLDDAEAAEISPRAAVFTRENAFLLHDSVSRSQWAFYVQDSIRATANLSVNLGIRFDRTRLLVPASQWSPRLGAAHVWPATGTTIRASVNRLFQPPQPEHLLLSSSAAARELSPFAGSSEDGRSGGADIEPERQTAWEIGGEQWLGGLLRLDAAFWSRHVRNYADPNVFFGTTILFPNSVARGTANGLDARLEMARYRGWSSYVSYTLSKVEQVGPINGGLFLEDNTIDIGPGTRFTPDHDQRHVSAAGVAYQNQTHRFSGSLTARYESGTPLEIAEDDADALMARPGAARVDFERGRVRPRLVFDATFTQVIRRGARMEALVRLGVFNLTNHPYALNFANPFSGTHFGAPRTARVELEIGLR